MIAAPAAVIAFPQSGEVAVLAGFDGASAVEIVARAGGAIVRVDGRSGVAVAAPGFRSDGFVGRLYREGAWLVFDPIALGGCRPLLP